MSQPELCREYMSAGAFCLPCRVVGSDRDGIPNVLVEAMACGAPVVTTNISGIPELVSDGVDGLLVPPADPAALAAAVMRLHRDGALAARLGAAGRATVRDRFDGDRLALRLADLFLAELGR
jgi:glycosyltransferase involved in cell wall biosynthesis